MGTRAEELADTLEAWCHELSRVVEGPSEADWKRITAAEQWPVGVVAHHVGLAHLTIGARIHAVAKGRPSLGITTDTVNANNRRHVREEANVTKAETLALLESSGANAAALVRGLSDDELDRSGTVLAGTPAMTAAQGVERILIDHVREHLGNIRATAELR